MLRTEVKFLEQIWNHKRPPTAKDILKKEKKTGGINPRFQYKTTKLQSSNSMVLAQKQMHGSVNRTEPRKRPMIIWSANL